MARRLPKRKQKPTIRQKINRRKADQEYRERHYSQVREKEKVREKTRKPSKAWLQAQEFYITNQWRNARQLIIENDRFLCLVCLSRGELVEAGEVHHIITVYDCFKSGELSLLIDHTNLISLSIASHEQVHELYRINSRAKQKVQSFLVDLATEMRQFLLENELTITNLHLAAKIGESVRQKHKIYPPR
ncbi:hypothetical protein V6R21_20200 [Limibacter armeniacum]|uniref:hypothetical protein n=1 Tax=Limibacter armeniacum TaxID=466084 RepID=UPI002FE648E9